APGADEPKPARAADRPAEALPEGALARLSSNRLRHGAMVSDLAFSPDGKRLVSAGRGRLRVWDAATGRLEHRFSVGGDAPAVAFSADGAQLTSTSRLTDEGCRVFDLVKGKELRRVTLRDSAGNSTLAVAPGGGLVALGEPDNVYLCDPAGAKKTLHVKIDGLSASPRLAFSPDGKLLAVGDTFNGTVHVHDTAAGKRLAEFKGEKGRLLRLTFSPYGRSLAAVLDEVAAGGTLVVWEVA